MSCIMDFPVRTADQLPALLRSLRKASGLTQTALAARLDITQQTLSAMERNAENVSASRLINVLAILGVELVLRRSGEATPPTSRRSHKPQW
jgi:HTH-type transcriptional regulator / antitoxin HipB